MSKLHKLDIHNMLINRTFHQMVHKKLRTAIWSKSYPCQTETQMPHATGNGISGWITS